MYSDWIPVPADKSTRISEIKEGKKFQLKTDKKIDENNDIRWTLGGVGSFWIVPHKMASSKCALHKLNGTEGFFLKAGILTFLKTSTKLQIWFDDKLEVTWVYEDDSGGICAMRRTLTWLTFNYNGDLDDVSSLYRYQIGGKSNIIKTFQWI